MKYFDRIILKELDKFHNPELEKTYNIYDETVSINREDVIFVDALFYEQTLQIRLPKEYVFKETVEQFPKISLYKVDTESKFTELKYDKLPIKIYFKKYNKTYWSSILNQYSLFQEELENELTNIHFLEGNIHETEEKITLVYREILETDNLLKITFAKCLDNYAYIGTIECINRESDYWFNVMLQIVDSFEEKRKS